MAKYKSRGLGHKQFFTMSVLAVSVLGLIFVTSAAQQKTNTQSDASGCMSKPVLKFIGTKNEPERVWYDFEAKNTNPSSCTKKINYTIRTVNKPSKNWDTTFWRDFRGGDGSDPIQGFDLASGKSHKWYLMVWPPDSTPKGTYYFGVRVCAGLFSTSNCSTQTYKYIKD